MGQRFLCPGSKIELTADADVIPAGTYTFVRRHDELLEFSVTPEISFVLASSYWGHLVRPTSLGKRSTSESSFLTSYAQLLTSQESKDHSILKGAVSMCFMSKKALNQVTRYLNPESGKMVSRDAYWRRRQRIKMAA
jgi:hypothetical protein